MQCNNNGTGKSKGDVLIQNQKGQAALLIGIMTLTFLFFFQFVVNTGLLVNAKINLQNAADLAAYAGAATQARQLNRLSYLNYEMRRQYKKFLFRYYVLGNLAQVSHPDRRLDLDRRRIFTPSQNLNDDYRVPSVCIVFNGRDNYCQLRDLDPIDIPQANPLDAISVALNQQLQVIEQIRQQHCQSIGHLNRHTLIYWLYNTDPDQSFLKAELEKAQSGAGGTPAQAEKTIKSLRTIAGLTQGLGLVPREIILLQRIQNLERLINTFPQKGVDLEAAQDLQGERETPAYERTIQAFFSAFNTLGEHLFEDASIQLDELLPTGADDRAQLIRLQQIRTDFDSYYIELDPDKTGGQVQNPADPRTCRGTPLPVTARRVPVGVYKDPSILTYYAIRLKARVRLLFSPFQEVELKAYAAAQPFGSRVGPSFPGTDEKGRMFVRTGMKPPNLLGPCSSPECAIPNLPIFDPEQGGRNDMGWFRGEVLAALDEKISRNDNLIVSLDKAYEAAMAPNPWEAGKYNIPNDLGAEPGDLEHRSGGDPFLHHFNQDLVHSFYAPVFSPDESRNLEEALGQILQLQTEDAALSEVLLRGMQSYIGKLQEGQGELGEGLRVARIKDPFRTRDAAPTTLDPNRTVANLISLPSSMFLSDPALVRSSFNDVRSSQFRNRGRTGYSVKLVAFRTLQGGGEGGASSDGQGGGWSNVIPQDPETQADLSFIDH